MSDSEENYVEGQKRLCKEYNVDFEKVKELNLRITLLMKGIVKNKKAVSKILEANTNIQRNMDYWIEIWSLTTSPKATLTPKQKSLLELFMYLELAEGIFSEVVQAISYVLIEKGHDIYNPERMKFAKDYEELHLIPLFVKQQFLEEHEFSFVSNAVDRSLRNRIAHLRFVVNDDGSIVDIETGKILKGLTGITDRLGCVCAVTLLAMVGSLRQNNL